MRRVTDVIYAGLDVSDKTTHVCVVDTDGKIIRRDVVASDSEVLAKWLNRHCSDLARVVLETGPLSTFSIMAWRSEASQSNASARATRKACFRRA